MVLGFHRREGFRVGKVVAQAFIPAWIVAPYFGLRWSLLHGLTPFFLWQMKVPFLLALVAALVLVGGHVSVKF